MDDLKYKNALEAVKADIIEGATEMGLDVEWIKREILTDDHCMALLQNEIAEAMLKQN